ncbi:hypothetical protein HY945_01745 [Candidatus Gottesmanbacteria bacterium]|nr:hypothetical protein [Candidatus Gottesmanbacteria bacterium]
MKKSKSLRLPKVPKEIEVKIVKTKGGNYIAELVKYDVFTQAKSIEELPFLVNDLIYTLFDIPKKMQSHIWFQPVRQNPLTKVENISLHYQILASQKFDSLLHA